MLLGMLFWVAQAGAAVIAGWDTSTQPGGANNFGASPLTASAADVNVTVGALTRGTGVATTGTGAARGWGGTTWNSVSAPAAVTANQFVSFTVTPKTGYTLSLSSLSRFDYRRSATGATSGVVQYQIGAGAFTDIATVSYTSTSSAGAAVSPAISLSGIADLQNIAAGTTVTFRIVNYGASGATGTWYIFDQAVSTANDLELSGTASAATPVAGVCGTDNGATALAASAPSNLCGVGTPSAVAGSGHPWSWSCAGLNGGATSSCSSTIASYAVNFSGGANGTISGTASQSVDYGLSATAVTAVPNAGYAFSSWIGSNGFTSTANPLVLSNVTAAQTITANYSSAVVNGSCGADDGVTLAATAPTNLCAAGTASVVAGAGHPWTWSCTGSNGGTTSSCSASIQTYSLNFTTASGGTLTGSTSQTVDFGASSSPVSAVPNAGATFFNWTGTAGLNSTTNPLVISNVSASQNVQATFRNNLTIFHTNDVHARLTPHKWQIPAHGTADTAFEDVGGAAALAGEMLSLTAARPDALVLDGGDISEGNPVGDLNTQGCPAGTTFCYGNGGMTQFYTLLSAKLKAQRGRGIDALVVGNHDVRDATYITNMEAMRDSGVPVLSVNVRDLATHAPHFAPYTTLTVNGLKIGIIGFTTPSATVGASLVNTLEVVDCPWSGGTTGCNMSTYVTTLRTTEHCDLVILLTHDGHSDLVDPTTPILADVASGPAVPEIAVTGHWHTWAESVWQPQQLNYKTIFAESSSYMKYLGELTVTASGKYVSSQQHVLANATINPDPDVSNFVAGLVSTYNNLHPGFPVDEVVGYSNNDLQLDNKLKWWSADEYPWSGNNTAGQWITDAMQWKAAQIFGSCDLAVEAGGGVRSDIAAGAVTFRQVYETFPWADDLYVRVNMTGQDILNFLLATNMDAGFSSAIDVTAYDGYPTQVLVNGQPLDKTHTYTVAINDYMYAHPPTGYTWTDLNPLRSTVLVRDSLSEFMRSQHATPATAYSTGGARYHLNGEFAGGYRAVVIQMDDNESKPSFERAFIRLLSATGETLARRGSAAVPTSLVNADGSINQGNRLAEIELYRSYLGFKKGTLKAGDIIETYGKAGFFGGDPEFIDQEGIYGDATEFKIVGHDETLAQPADFGSIGAFWNDQYENHLVRFHATKSGTDTVTDQMGQTIKIWDPTGYNTVAAALPGIVGDVLEIVGVPTSESFGLRFRRADPAGSYAVKVVTAASLPPAIVVSSKVTPFTSATVTSGSITVATNVSNVATLRLTPVADAQVASGSAGTNYGSKTNMFIQSSSTSSFGDERGWLRFDLTTLPTNVTVQGARLELWNYKSTGAALPVEVRSSVTDTWTETGLNWNNQPALGAVLDTQTLASGASSLYYRWNVGAFVQQEFAGDKLVSLVAKPVAEGSVDATPPAYGFDTKEFGSTIPQLAVDAAQAVASVQLYYRYSNDTLNWGAWTPAGPALTAAPYSAAFTFPNGNGYYQFYSLATNANGVSELAPASAQATVQYVPAVLLAQTITFTQPASLPATGAGTLIATASSGLVVTLTSQSPAVCTVVGSQVSALTAGTCTIAANQAGNAQYQAAPTVTRSFAVTLLSQTVQFAPVGDLTLGGAVPTLDATASSGLQLTFSSQTPAVCSVSGSALTLLSVGTCTLSATQAGSSVYDVASATQSFQVVASTAGDGDVPLPLWANALLGAALLLSATAARRRAS
jgi:2',3'-cyclic-nucleotide 2'-phosphodiesterase (5'-nucleotidase family)